MLSTAKHMPADLRFLRVRLQSEEHRLLDWGTIANVSEDERLFNRSVRLNRHLVNDVLQETQVLLLGCCALAGRQTAGAEPATSAATGVREAREAEALRELQPRFPQSGGSVRAKALHWIQSTRKYPKQLHWAIFDKKKFEELLANLGRLNDFMERLMDTASQEMLHRAQQETFLQVLQLNDKVDDLLQIMNASSAHRDTNDNLLPRQLRSTLDAVLEPDDGNDRRQQTHKLVQLARFKILNTAIDTGTLNNDIARQIDIRQSLSAAVDPRLDYERFEYISTSQPIPEDAVRSEGLYEMDEAKIPVWVEWKYYLRHPSDEGPPKLLQNMVSNLSALLHDNQKPAQFHAPDCLGYFDDPDSDRDRFGLVFKKPARSLSARSALVTLHGLFQGRKPSLTARIKLASSISNSISYLHSTDWLHKGLRSQNILFFDDPAHVNLANPYLCGFDYSRPAEASNLTQAPPQDPEQDIYRHPDVQGSALRDGKSGGFKKSHDVYSLGIILMEIAAWKPIDQILAIDYLHKAKPAVVRRVRATILETSRYLDDIEAEAGDVFRQVCSACFHGEETTSTGELAKGEAKFRRDVVQKLGTMVL
ncbi:hypothetical protein MMC11_006605 [Xylographa trunciseda]|nr:hypothetical protein [Xylographa trunciseda]